MMQLKQAIVRVWHKLPHKGGEYRGTAFLISPGSLVTAKHVVESLPVDELFLQGQVWDGLQSLENVFCHHSLDIAVLKLKKQGDVSLHIPLASKEQAEIQQGQWVILAGYGTPHAGLETPPVPVSAYDGVYDLEVIHSSISKGMSGGPVLFNDQLAGVTIARHHEENKTFLLRLNSFRDFIEPFTKKSEYQLAKVNPSQISAPNPFYFSGAIPADLFHGRKDILQTIKNRIAGQVLQSVSIVGERRIGKTSLLNYVKNELVKRLTQHRYLIIYLDLMKAYCHTRKGLMQKLRKELTNEWRKPWQESEDGNLFTFDFALEELQSENIRLVLCLDEVENIAKRPAEFDDLLEDWRACGSMGQMAMITASVETLADLCKEHKLVSPFFNIFSQSYLGLFETGEWKELITQNMPASNEDLDFIEQAAGGHPFFTQMTGYYLWEMKTGKNADYGRLKTELNEQMRPHLEYLWNRLNDSEKSALRYCIGKTSVKPAESVLNRMTLRGILRNGKLFSSIFEELVSK